MMTTSTMSNNYDPYVGVVVKAQAQVPVTPVLTKEVTKEEPVKETKVVVIEKAIEEAYMANLSGGASFYGEEQNGKRTANGEIFTTYELTAAHKSLPFGTKVKVVNKKTLKITEIPFGTNKTDLIDSILKANEKRKNKN